MTQTDGVTHLVLHHPLEDAPAQLLVHLVLGVRTVCVARRHLLCEPDQRGVFEVVTGPDGQFRSHGVDVRPLIDGVHVPRQQIHRLGAHGVGHGATGRQVCACGGSEHLTIDQLICHRVLT